MADMPPQADDGVHGPANFAHVLTDELEQVDARRARLGLGAAPAGGADPLERSRKRRLVGLAFSGGGIRSATFNLGLLQGLADLGLLPLIDYLSTVSGGGYVGSWLVANVKRTPGGLRTFERQLRTTHGGKEGMAEPAAPAGPEPEPIRHLRRYSNYLAPRTGFLSADTWVLWATYLRNFLLTQCVILPTTFAVLLLSRLALLFYHPWPGAEPPQPKKLPVWCFGGMTVIIALLWGFALAAVIRGAGQVRRRGAATDTPDKPMSTLGLLLRVVVPLGLGAILFCWFAAYPPPWRSALGWPPPSWPELGQRWAEAVTFGLLIGMLVVLAYATAVIYPAQTLRQMQAWAEIHALVLAALLLALVVGLPGGLLVGAVGTVAVAQRADRCGDGPRIWPRMLAAAAAGLLGGILLYWAYRLLHGLYEWDNVLAKDYIQVRATAAVTTFGPPLVLVTLVLSIFVAVGLLERLLGEELREWWSSVCARLLLAALFWLSVNLVGLYGTALVLWAGPGVRTALASGWLLTVAGGVLAGGSRRTEARRPQKSRLELLARIAPHVFVAGLLVGVSLLIRGLVDEPPRWEDAPETVWPRNLDPKRPSTRITRTRMRSADGAPAERVEEVREHTNAIDEARVVQEMYWLSILNTCPDFVPTEKYHLTDQDLNRLKAENVSADIRKKLPSGPKTMTRAEFEAVLAKLPRETPEAIRNRIFRYAKDVQSIEFCPHALAGKLFLWLLGCAAVIGLAMWRVDVNLFSLHALYGNRLVRCYLGASRPAPTVVRPAAAAGRRCPDPVTELDPNDDFPLAELRPNAADYDGPFLLVNTSLNLVHGNRLDWQDRKAESFVLTPLYCGSEDTGYRATAVGEAETGQGYAGNVLLGTAVTISGAAASPNMGYHSSPAVTALLTVFNARLGAWLGNPASPTRWRRAGPTLGFLYLFRELFGWTRARGGYVYLSDGGHFENLGVYELVRRRCRYIILSDAGQDPAHVFEDLGNLIHKCRADFGIRIEIDLGSLRLLDDAAEKPCRWHCALGRIRYDDVDPRAAPGTLVFLKPSLTGDEPADVLHYAERHHDFPHQTTADQFFTESQFESYRALGHHIALTVFQQSVDDMLAERIAPAETVAGRHQRRCQALFSSLVRRWFAMPPAYEAAFVDAARGFIQIQEAFRKDARLWRLALDLYPELEPKDEEDLLGQMEEPGERAARRAAEVSIIVQMLQVMENAWLSLNLDVHYAHPLNRGWMDIFHRWTSARTVREQWPVVRAEFGRGFVSFCEKQMRMGVVEGRAERLADGDPIPELLAREFADQWPEEEGLVARLTRQGDARLAWLVYAADPTPLPPPAPVRAPCGIVLVNPAAPPPDGARTYELFVWMRGAYRNTGLGRPALRQVLDELRQLLGLPFRLSIKLPTGDLTGPGGQLQRGMWLTFFYHLGFERSAPAQAAKEARVWLEQTFV